MALAFQQCESHPGKPLTGHLEDVASRVAGEGALVQLAALFHDVGKGTDYFQAYLKGQAGVDLRLKQHSYLGALWLLHHLWSKVSADALSIDQAVLPYLMVAHHHTGLRNALDSLPPDEETELRQRGAKQLEALDAKGAVSWLEKVLKEPIAEAKPDFPWVKVRVRLARAFRQAPGDLPAMEKFQEVLHSFGVLIEADRDSAAGYARDRFKSPARFTSAHLQRFRAAAKFGAADPRVIQAREEVYQAAVAGADARSFDSGHLWSLTVPTGAAKTLAAIGWAFRRREGRVAAGHTTCPIIYALPFTSIIDQNAGVLQRLWGADNPDESTLAVHHHVAEPGNLARSGEQSLARSWTEGWRADIVCTTFVQVVNALFHGTVADSRRFASMAGSILILDEVQSIPAKYWRAINIALSSLCKRWGTDVLLVTATQPAIFEQADVQELRPAFQVMTRTAFDRYDLCVQTEGELSLNDLAQRVYSVLTDPAGVSCLAILNTVQEALDVFSSVRSQLGPTDCPIFHLSTNLRPKDRKRILEQISQWHGKRHLLIATQVVEAGVDLSFDVIFRALAPLDAVVQAAGRCNRHGTGRRGQVFLIRTAGNSGHFIYGNKEMGAAQEILEKVAGQAKVIPEPELQEVVVEYFRVIASRTGRDSFDKIMEAITCWEFGSLRGDDDQGKSVCLIDERQDSIPHYVEIDSADEKVWQQFQAALMIQESFVRRGKLRNLRPQLGQCIVEVPKKYAMTLEVSDNTGLVHVPMALAAHRYDANTGWIR